MCTSARDRRTQSRSSIALLVIAAALVVFGAGAAWWAADAPRPAAGALPLGAGSFVLLAMLPRARRDDAAVVGDEQVRSLLQVTLEATTDGLITTDLAGRIVSHNQKLLDIWQLEKADLDGGVEAVVALIVEQLADPAAFRKRIEELTANADVTSCDLVEFRDGRIFQRRSQPHRVGEVIVGRIWSFRDLTSQRQAEAALLESERRFRRMAANIPGVIFQFVIDDDDVVWYTYLSDGARGLLGVYPGSFPWRGEALEARIHPSDYRNLRALTVHSAAVLEPWTWEGRITSDDGSTRWLRAASRPTLDIDGTVAWDGLLMDITQEKVAREALHRREEQLAEAQRIAHIGSWEYDFVSGESSVSAELQRIFGVEQSSGSWPYVRFLEMAHPNDRTAANGVIRRATEVGGPFEFNTRIVRPDGAERYVTVRGRVILDAQGMPSRILGTVQDVTEARYAEERFRHLFDHAADAFFLHDVDGRIVAVNRQACESLGYTHAELMHLNVGDFVRRPEGAPARDADAPFAPESAGTTKSFHVRKDGSVFPTEVRTGPFSDGSDRPLIIAIARDVTEQRKAAAALEKRIGMERALTRVSRMLAAPSPDLDLILQLLGESIGADRAHLFRTRAAATGLVMDSTNEWCAEGVPATRQDLQSVDTASVPWWIEQLTTTPSLVIQSLDELPPEAKVERATLERSLVQATAAVPILDPRNGLLGFLGFDYVKSQRTWPEDDVRLLRTAGEMLVSSFARELAEREILQRDAILTAASFMAERFLRATDWEGGIEQALALVGTAAGVSRAYLFRTSPGENGEILVDQRAEWVDEGVQPMMPERGFARASLHSLGLGRWDELFRRNLPVQGIVSALPEYEAMCLDAQGIRAILQIPIFVGDHWWGTLGFDDCVRERAWSLAEREVLETTGRMIAAAVQRTQAEAALSESEERFRQMAENIREVFYMASVETNDLIYLSPAYNDVWGRSQDASEAGRRAFFDAIVPEDRSAILAHFARSREGEAERERTFEYRIERPDGTIRWIRNRTFQIPGDDGRPLRIAGVCSDITAQKQMEEELRRANRIEAIGHLAAGIAHEINTPIQYIGDNIRFLDESYAEIRAALAACRALMAEVAAGPVAAERIVELESIIAQSDVDYVLDEAPRASAQALDGVQRVAEIVRGMKEFAHPGSAEKVATDLNQAIRSTAAVARNEWRYVAELITELDPDLPLIHCLPGDFNQAILNLVVNAAHAIADRRDRDGSDTPGVITVATAAIGDLVEVRVSDTGTGIPAEIRQRIFDPFFTTKEVGRGTGQGLTFVHSIVVEKHGGTVSFESETGVGTTFILRLPHSSGPSSLSEAA